MSQGYGQGQPQRGQGGQGDPWAATRQGVPQWQDPRAPQPYQPYGPPPGYQPQHAPPPQRPAPRKRRVFLWVFLGIQVLFVIWLATGIAGTSHSGTSAHAQAVTFCADKANWQYLYKSQADCITHYGNALNGASDVGKSPGAGIIVAVWVVTDFLAGLGYGIYRLASRR